MPTPTSLLRTFAQGASTALLIQSLGVGLIYLMQVLFARWLGATEYGIYEYVMTISTVLAFLAGFGLPTVALRFIAEYSVKQDWAHLRGIIWGSWWQNLLVSIGVAGCGIGILFWLNAQSPLPHFTVLVLGMMTVPPIVLLKLQLEMVRAVQRIGLAYAPSLVVLPLLLLLIISLWHFLNQSSQPSFNSSTILGMTLGAMVIVLIGQLLLFLRGLPALRRVRPVYAWREWLLMALPSLFSGASFILLNQTDTLMIGAVLSPASVGIYSAALKTAAWVNFILVSVNAIAAPMFATLYAQGKRTELQRLVSTIARWMFYPALAVAVGLIVFAEPILELFGAEFVAAKWAMIVLIGGQLVNVGAGSVGYLLNMTGHHNQCAFVVGCSALLNLILNLIGIPLLGVLGAALATAISMSVWNIWLNRLVIKYLGVNPSIVAALRGDSVG
jgi:O-antigen/teichoic acid export membrane protein